MEERSHHRETLLPSSLLKTMGRKRSRSESSSSSSSSSSTSTEDEERKRKKSKLKKEKKHKRKKEEKKRKKEKKKPKKSRKGEQKDTKKESITRGVEEPPPRKAGKSKGLPLPPSVAAGGAAAAVPKTAEPPAVQRKAMVPMTKEEYENQQSVVREVYDPETGRMRLVKGTGEIIERIVTQQEQRQINKMATQGDGLSFQAKLLSTLQQQG